MTQSPLISALILCYFGWVVPRETTLLISERCIHVSRGTILNEKYNEALSLALSSKCSIQMNTM